jgi:F-type H+-transporting ATPase subunit b
MNFSPILAFQRVDLVPDGTLFIHIAIILLMIWILNRTFFRPLNRIIESREKNKGGRSGEAREILKSVEEKRSRFASAMLKARIKGYKLIEEERGTALAKGSAKIGKVKEEVAEFTAQEKAELERQTAEAKAALSVEAEKIAEKISSNILKV